MTERPFVFQDVVVDRQRRQRIGRAVTKAWPNLAFHSEDTRALHLREIGEYVGVRLKINNEQLRRDVFYCERNDAESKLRRAECPDRQRIEPKLQGCAFD
jgi:hypothetical protein